MRGTWPPAQRHSGGEKAAASRRLIPFFFAVVIMATILATSASTVAQSREGGWYLIVPPSHAEGPPKGKPAHDLPFSKWDQEATFDSARECEAALKKSREEQVELVLRMTPVREVMPGLFSSVVERSAALQSAQCVNSNDPRLVPERGR